MNDSPLAALSTDPDPTLPEVRTARALEHFVPLPFACVLACECAIVVAAFCAWFRSVPVGPGVFGYWRSTIYRPLLMVLPLILIPDWILVNVLVPNSLLWIRIAHGVGNIYFLIWAFGVCGLFKTRPHRIETQAQVLRLHCGVFKTAAVPLSSVESARVVQSSDLPRACRLDLKGSPQVELVLRETVPVLRALLPIVSTRRLLVSADDAAGLCAAIDAART